MAQVFTKNLDYDSNGTSYQGDKKNDSNDSCLCFYLLLFVFSGLGVCCSSCVVWHRNGSFVYVACPLVAVVSCGSCGGGKILTKQSLFNFKTPCFSLSHI